ncbi:MAG TPA: SUMF1/EgtB/PvdO family nonheme iron enzyme, partial [Kofleriaceae bacterium]
LVARSRRQVRRQAAAVALLVAVAVAVPGYTAYRSHLASQRQEREMALKARNLGQFVLSLEPFDWDPEAQRATAADPAPLGLDWQLQAWTDDGPGEPYVEHDDVEHTAPRPDGAALVQDVEARGGRAYLTIRRRGCTPSLLPVKDLPGYAQRDRPIPTFHVRVPTCAATAAGMIEIPAGLFRYGGAGTPPSRIAAELGPEQRIDLPRFWIDRTEVTNAAFAMLADMAALTGIEAPSYPPTPILEHAADPKKPVTGVNWYTARDYCRYLGKDLPTSEQWVKAMRGGEQLADGSDNPIPDRNYPFGIGDPYRLAALIPSPGTADVATHPGDVSPYGVLDLTGNAEEWTLTAYEGRGIRVLRGGGVAEQMGDALLDFMAIPNPRVASQPLFAIGERCVVNDGSAPPPADRR